MGVRAETKDNVDGMLRDAKDAAGDAVASPAVEGLLRLGYVAAASSMA